MTEFTLTPIDKKVIWQCLNATVNGPFFPEWEFPTIIGIEREDLRLVLESWPNVDFSDPGILASINNSIYFLFSYPHNQHDVLKNYLKYQVKTIFRTREKIAKQYDKIEGVTQENFNGPLKFIL